MKLLSTSADNTRGLPAGRQGFTLVEVLISLGILAMLLAFTLPFTINFYRRFQYDSERANVVSYLRQARTMSLDGQGSAHHGLHVGTDEFTIFEGPSYAGRDPDEDIIYARDTNVTITDTSEIVFTYLYGKTPSLSFTLNSSAKQGKIYVNSEGRIDYD